SRPTSCSPIRSYSSLSTCRNRFSSRVFTGRDESGRCRQYVSANTDRRRLTMSVIVIEFITMDGVVTDPDGSGGTAAGGWAFRHGPEAVAGDKFRLGRVLDDGVMLLGRRTWELFAKIWPGRDTPFARRMNAVPKLVVSRTLTDASAWANSQVAADPIDVVQRERRDVIITGSLSVVQPL